MQRAGHFRLTHCGTGIRPTLPRSLECYDSGVRNTQFHRITAGTAVLLLHAALLSAFLFANYTRTASPNAAMEIEIRFPPPAPAQKRALPPALQPRLLSPTAPTLPAVPGELFAPLQIPSPTPGAMSGVGRALFGCDPQKLDLLSPQNRAACLRLPRGKAAVASLRMPAPADPNSPFTKEIEERFREAAPINRPCPLGSYNDTHGLPCFGFGEKSPLLPSR